MALLRPYSSSVIPFTPYASDSAGFAALCSPYKVAPFCERKNLVIFAVISPGLVRKPSLPPTTVLSKPTALISERVLCTDVMPGSKIVFKYAKSPGKEFCDFMLTSPKQEVIAFFRDIAAEVEGFRQLQDFHMKLRDIDGEFQVEVYFRYKRRGPELAPYVDCIGCSMDTNLFVGQDPGMASKECILEDFSIQPYAVCRMDAKGRFGFSIMPLRHVERMSDLNDEELYAVWSIGARLLQHFGVPFISLIMNHGSYRSFFHLNLKLWLDGETHKKLLSALSEETRELWYQLQMYAANRPKKQQACFFFKRDGWCRHGEYCSYLHCRI